MYGVHLSIDLCSVEHFFWTWSLVASWRPNRRIVFVPRNNHLAPGMLIFTFCPGSMCRMWIRTPSQQVSEHDEPFLWSINSETEVVSFCTRLIWILPMNLTVSICEIHKFFLPLLLLIYANVGSGGRSLAHKLFAVFGRCWWRVVPPLSGLWLYANCY